MLLDASRATHPGYGMFHHSVIIGHELDLSSRGPGRTLNSGSPLERSNSPCTLRPVRIAPGWLRPERRAARTHPRADSRRDRRTVLGPGLERVEPIAEARAVTLGVGRGRFCLTRCRTGSSRSTCVLCS